MIDSECGKDSAALLSEGKHYLMIEWSEPLPQAVIDDMQDYGRAWLVFSDIAQQNWQNSNPVVVPFGYDWTLTKGDVAHSQDSIDPNRVLSINLGTTDNGASEIVFVNSPADDPDISIKPDKMLYFVDAAGNPAYSDINAIIGVNNLPIAIENLTIPWIEKASTQDTNANGKIDEILLEWNTEVALVYHFVAADPNLHVDETVDNSTLTSALFGPREITAIDPAPQKDTATPYTFSLTGDLILTEISQPFFTFDTDYTGELSLYIDANTYFLDEYDNVRDQMHAGGCPVLDGAPAIPIKACVWNSAIDGTYEVEIHFSEAVEDPTVSADELFEVVGADPNYVWLNDDGTDGILNFLITDNSQPFMGAPPIINIIGDIRDKAPEPNVTPYGNINTITQGNVMVQGPADKPDYFAYPAMPPFDASGPIISDSSMDLEGYVTRGGVPLDQALYDECSPCCEGIVMAFRHKNLFDPDPNSDNYGKLIIDPARCAGATRLRRHDGYYAMHIYGDCCGNADEGGAIILVVAIYDTCNSANTDTITENDWPLDATNPKYINGIFIMTGLVPSDTGYYLEWEDSQGMQQPLFNMELDDCEKIYLRKGWNSLSTTIDKLYFDEDGTPSAPTVNPNVVALRNSDDAVTAVSVPMDDIEKVFATISPPLPVFTTPLGWIACCTYDPATYTTGSGGYILDYPSTHTNNGQNAIAYFVAGSGYLINMANPGVLVVLGTSVLDRPVETQPYTKEIIVGWNMVGYWSDILRMTPSAPNVNNFKPGDFSSVWTFGPGLGPYELIPSLTPDGIFIGAGATHLRTNVNIDNGTYSLKGVKVWDSSFQSFDFTFFGSGMSTWLEATTNTLQYD
jgi:hypothetical protein